MMSPFLFPDEAVYLLVKICTLVLAVLVWWVVTSPELI